MTSKNLLRTIGPIPTKILWCPRMACVMRLKSLDHCHFTHRPNVIVQGLFRCCSNVFSPTSPAYAKVIPTIVFKKKCVEQTLVRQDKRVLAIVDVSIGKKDNSITVGNCLLGHFWPIYYKQSLVRGYLVPENYVLIYYHVIMSISKKLCSDVTSF